MALDKMASTIQELCAEKGLSVNRLAKQAGLTQSTIDSILKGKSTNPRMDTIEKIADGFGMDRTEFWVRIKSVDADKFSPNQKHFMKKMRSLRESMGLSMKEFETKLELPDGKYPYWETGVFHPTIDALVKISKYFSIPVDDLLGLTDTPTPNQ